MGEAPYRDTRGTFEETEKLLDLKNPPTCILYPDDFAALGGINAIHARGMKIPEDISIAGYDGSRIARHFEPQLTTLKQDTKQIGSQAAEKLINLIERPKTTLVEQIIVTGEVIPGTSVKQI